MKVARQFTGGSSFSQDKSHRDDTNAEKVRAVWQNKYGGHKVHDIRHVVATELAQKEIESKIANGLPKSDNERKKAISDIAKIVGAKLGNNPSQALSTYINPKIWKQLKQ